MTKLEVMRREKSRAMMSVNIVIDGGFRCREECFRKVRTQSAWRDALDVRVQSTHDPMTFCQEGEG